MTNQIPTIGRIVLYALNAADVKDINYVRTQLNANPAPNKWVGNSISEGQLFPMLIVAAWGSSPGSSVNGTVFLDAPDQTLFKTSVSVGEQPGSWRWPEIVKPAAEEPKTQEQIDADLQAKAGGAVGTTHTAEAEGASGLKQAAKAEEDGMKQTQGQGSHDHGKKPKKNH